MTDSTTNAKSTMYRLAFARKDDTTTYVGSDGLVLPEDTFSGSYDKKGGKNILEPAHHPALLHSLAVQNNTLLQCIEAMEINIEGTGHKIVKKEGASEDKGQKQLLESFFAEPYPGKSMTMIRRAVRRDLEECGFGFIEVILDAGGKVVFLNHLESEFMRLVKLDAPVTVEKTVIRNGGEHKVSLRVRERRFVRKVGTDLVYYSEFGASRRVDAATGEWITKDTKGAVPGNQIIYFQLQKDARSVYACPRWVNQIPSVLGSRKAEELNLDFFDAGGVPPALVIVQGGALGTGVVEQLQSHFGGAVKNSSRVAVVEAISTSGGLDSAGSVQVRVERFGSERVSDGMFSKYDDDCRKKVRLSFRLPPLFLGEAADYNFATAKTAYMVAEAQVFLPEREEFDSRINNTIVRALGVTNYEFKSLPLTLIDVDNQLNALTMVSDKYISGESVVSLLNEITGLNMEYEKQAQPATPPVVPQPSGDGGQPPVAPQPAGTEQPEKARGPAASDKQPEDPKALAAKVVKALKGDGALGSSLLSELSGLSGPERLALVSTIGAGISGDEDEADLFNCALSLTAKSCSCGGAHEG